MLIGIVGGRLQGTEIAYLAREAGYRTLLVDRDPRAPAAGLVDSVATFDMADRTLLRDVIGRVDIVFPAIENTAILEVLSHVAGQAGTPVVLDLDAYRISASKLESNRLFAELGIPAPRPFPECGFPVIAKPCFGSGSEGVRMFTRQSDMDSFLSGREIKDWCIQEFADGPSYSVEVIGRPGDYQAILVTELFMDEIFDCRKVVAPARLPGSVESDFKSGSIAIAEAIGLRGIMDAEVILAGGKLLFLEIDARFPSQTPIAVYHATGINMVETLADLFLNRQVRRRPCMSVRSTSLEHVRITKDGSRCLGEHIMAQCGPLRVMKGFLDSEIAITNFRAGSNDCVATLINRSPTRHDAPAHS